MFFCHKFGHHFSPKSTLWWETNSFEIQKKQFRAQNLFRWNCSSVSFSILFLIVTACQCKILFFLFISYCTNVGISVDSWRGFSLWNDDENDKFWKIFFFLCRKPHQLEGLQQLINRSHSLLFLKAQGCVCQYPASYSLKLFFMLICCLELNWV